LRAKAIAELERFLRLNLEHIPPSKELILASLEWLERLKPSKVNDAQYVALAESLGAELWSADQRLISALGEQGMDWAHWVGEV